MSSIQFCNHGFKLLYFDSEIIPYWHALQKQSIHLHKSYSIVNH